MPLLSYFSIVGTALLGLLFVADAVLPDRPPLKFSTDTYGLPVNPPSQRVVRIHNLHPAPAPDMTSLSVMFANLDAPPAAAPVPPPDEVVSAVASPAEPRSQRVAERTAKRPKQQRRVRDEKRQEWQDRNWFAWSASERRRAPESQGRREPRQLELSQRQPPLREPWQPGTWQREARNRPFWQLEAQAHAGPSRESWSPWGSIR
jgi:hypothetical protein